MDITYNYLDNKNEHTFTIKYKAQELVDALSTRGNKIPEFPKFMNASDYLPWVDEVIRSLGETGALAYGQ
jgi:hypothetical protein